MAPFKLSNKKIRNHENHSHDDQKMRTCPYCPKVMTRMSVFYKHANEAHKDQVRCLKSIEPIVGQAAKKSR